MSEEGQNPATLWIIVSYKNAHLTRININNLLSQTVPVNIAVWDNNSPDGSGAKLGRWFHGEDRVKIFKSPENILWTPALNRAVEKFWDGERYVGFANNDVVLPKHATKELIKTASKRNVGMVGPTGSGLGGPQDFVSHHGPYADADKTNLGPKRTTYLVGACIFMRKEVYDLVGPFDEDMPLGADDHDYSIRIKQKGLEIWVDESVYIAHSSHATGSSPEWGVHGTKSWEAFAKKWSGYYSSEEEAKKSHWGGIYHEGYDK